MGATTAWSSSCGGPATPAVGWAAGIERILLALEGEHEGTAAESDVFIVAESEDDRRTAATLAAQLRRVGISARSTWPAAASRVS